MPDEGLQKSISWKFRLLWREGGGVGDGRVEGTECCLRRNQPTETPENEPRKDCVDGATLVCLPFDFSQEVFLKGIFLPCWAVPH